MKSRFLFLVLAFSLPGCSLLTKNGRQQWAYERYVRKSSITRARSSPKVKFRMADSQLRPSSPQVRTNVLETPQSVTAAPSETAPETPAEPQSEPAP